MQKEFLHWMWIFWVSLHTLKQSDLNWTFNLKSSDLVMSNLAFAARQGKPQSHWLCQMLNSISFECLKRNSVQQLSREAANYIPLAFQMYSLCSFIIPAYPYPSLHEQQSSSYVLSITSRIWNSKEQKRPCLCCLWAVSPPTSNLWLYWKHLDIALVV